MNIIQWVTLIILFLIGVGSISVLCFSFAKKLDDITKKNIETHGLYHITKRKHISNIMCSNRAYIKTSSRRKSYWTWYKRACFFFTGEKVDADSIFYNLRPKYFKEYVVIHIPPEECDELFISKLHYRVFDNAIAHIGSVSKKANIIGLDSIMTPEEYDVFSNKTKFHVVFYELLEFKSVYIRSYKLILEQLKKILP